MEFTSPQIIAISGLLGFLLLLLSSWKQRSKNKANLAPEPAGALPIIGHLHLLNQPTTLARTMSSLADKYGSIFMVRLGMQRALVISDAEAVKECFTTNDKVFASRPSTSQGKYLASDHKAFAFAPYGNYWRDTRKLAVLKLLSVQSLKTLRHHQASEVNALMSDLHFVCTNNGGGAAAGTKVKMNEWLERTTFNVITKIISGKRYFGLNNNEEARRVGKIIKEFMFIVGSLVPSDFIPFLGLIDFLTPQVKSMKRIANELDSLILNWIREHELQRRKGTRDPSKNQDFIDVMLSEIKDDSTYGFSRELVILATSKNLILGGSESTSNALTWALSNILNNKNMLKLAQEELDSKVGRDRWVDESDLESLVYVDAISKETLRLYPPAPMSFPHESMEDCTIGGYHIPKGTRLMVNVWKLQRDPKIWSNPEVFMPERFLTTYSNVDVYGQQFEYQPFGSGRRSCPGTLFAMQVMNLTLARLIQGFDLKTPSDGPVDMSEGPSISLPRATPLEVVVKPRLSPELYKMLN
uniref:Cytochrome P450 CYP71_1 n=1 Tax=Tripterygium wilfordii TaxID=458696 RepID=A0A1X9H7V3_TRIWF|nr:cytochrome P450 CYP71_1 [Tripterygium wilfordii]